MWQGGGYEQLEMAELVAEIAELESELLPLGGRPTAQPPPTPSGLERTMQKDIAELQQQVAQLSPTAASHDDTASVTVGGSMSEAIARHELHQGLDPRWELELEPVADRLEGLTLSLATASAPIAMTKYPFQLATRRAVRTART